MHPTKSAHLERNPDQAVSSPRIRAQEVATTILLNVLEVIDLINEQEKSNFRLGVIFLVISIVSWLIGLELVNAVLKTNDYHKPFFLLFLTGLCFLLYLLPELMAAVYAAGCACLGVVRRQLTAHHHQQSDSPLLSFSDLDLVSSTGDLTNKDRLDSAYDAAMPLSRREVLLLALQIAIVYYIYNALVMSALLYTSASNQTILGSTTAMFTLFMGVSLGIDKFTSKKVVCVVSSLMGVIFISLGEKLASGNNDSKFEPKNPALGNLLALLGAFSYGVYLLVMKVRCGMGNKTTDERKLFGWVGVFTFVLGLPVLVVAHSLGFEPFELPESNTAFAMIMINSVLSVISDYFTILAMLLTSPLVTSLALTSSIPITILADFIILHLTGHQKPSSSSSALVYGFGVFCILISVLLINVNLNTQNELIENVIEDTLEGAVRHDEVLSPVLSPYLEHSSPTLRNHDIGIPHLSPQFNLTRRKNTQRSPLSREVSGFSLNLGTSSPDQAPLKNANHLLNLYTIDSAIDTHEPQPTSEPAALMVYGGVNHNFFIKSVDPSASKSSDILPENV